MSVGPLYHGVCADASRFFSRIGYLILAVGGPVGVVLHPIGLYVMFSIGVGLILIASALDAARTRK